MSLYIDLVTKLREDAAAAVTALRRAREGAEASAISASEIRVWSGDDGRWWATPQLAGWLGGYAGDYGAASEVEALCALIERAHADAIAANGEAPCHLLERADGDAQAVATYRQAVRAATGAALRTLAELHASLDEVGEGWISGDDVDAIARVAERAS